jgi:hypothetical protein
VARPGPSGIHPIRSAMARHAPSGREPRDLFAAVEGVPAGTVYAIALGVPAGTFLAIAPGVPHRCHATPDVSRGHTACGKCGYSRRARAMHKHVLDAARCGPEKSVSQWEQALGRVSDVVPYPVTWNGTVARTL